MADIFDFYVYDDRSIQFAIAEPIMLEDKDVTQFRFRIPKSLNGFDMSEWEWWFIFVSPNGTKYTTLLELTDDEDEPEVYSTAIYSVGYGFSGIVGTVRFSLEALYVEGESIVNEWHTKTYRTTVTDTLQGHRAIIPEPEGQSSTGITEEVKQALLQIARKVAYIDEHGQTYYNALYDALYAIIAVTVSPRSISLSAIGQTSQLTAQTTPAGGTITWSTSNASVATVSANGLVTATGLGSATITATSGGKSGTCSVLVAEATLTEISAVYTPSGTVYESDSLDSLKSRLVVTAHWSNGTTSEVASADYTLSGTLTTGTSTVTVSYGGMTTTFEVTVVGLTGITATYTQSGTVYDKDALDSLKSDLVVVANYSDGTSATVTDYTLSGTLAAGTSVVTVTYGGQTATFNVTVTHYEIGPVTDGLITYFDLRTANYNNSAPGSKTVIYSNDGLYSTFAWAGNGVASQDSELGMSFANVRLNTIASTLDGTTALTSGNEWTEVIMSYKSIPSMNNGITNFNNLKGMEIGTPYTNTSNTVTRTTKTAIDIGYKGGNEMYMPLIARAKGDSFDVFDKTGEIVYTKKSSEISDFSSFSTTFGFGLVQATSSTGTKCIFYAIYNKALSDAQVLDMVDYLQTLEV